MIANDVKNMKEQAATDLTNVKARVTLIQDAQRKRDDAQDIKIDDGADDTNKIHTSQQVLEGYAAGLADDVSENKALLNNLTRSVNELVRQGQRR